jgi:hypothetical protein
MRGGTVRVFCAYGRRRSLEGQLVAHIVLLAVLAAAMTMPAAAEAEHSRIQLVAPGEEYTHFGSSSFAASDDGRYVFFASEESLVPEDTDGLCFRGYDYYYDPYYGPCVDLYEHDLRTGETKLVSTGPSGGSGHYDASLAHPSPACISRDGGRVFFETREPLVPEDTDSCPNPAAPPDDPTSDAGCTDAYERVDGVTKLVTTGAGTPANFDADLGLVSADGERVYFNTREQLVPEDTDGSGDGYVREGGTTTLITPGTGPHDSGPGPISDDGGVVLFTTRDNLVPEDTDHCSGLVPGPCVDLYRFHAASGEVELVSTGPNGNHDNSFVQPWYMTPDGRYVFFITDEALVDEDGDSPCSGDGMGTGGCDDIYRHDLVTGTTTLTTYQRNGGSAASPVTFLGAATDGSTVVFTTRDSLVEDWPELHDGVDVFEWRNGTIRLLSDVQGPDTPDAAQGLKDVLAGGVSSDGTTVFMSTSGRLLASDTDDSWDFYRRSGDVLEQVTIGPGGGNGPVDPYFFLGPSRDGGRILFESSEELVPGGSSTGVYEWLDGELMPLLPGVQARLTGLASTPDLRHLFVSTTSRLTADDTDDARDIYALSINAPPRCDGVAANVRSLSPADHALRGVRLTGADDPDGDPVTIEITGVTQDEPVRGKGDRTSPDARRTSDPNRVKLRAERGSKGDGRVYRISFRASDGAQSCTGEVKVGVPRKKHRPAVDSAPPSYDSLAG